MWRMQFASYEKNLVEGFNIDYKDEFIFCEGYV